MLALALLLTGCDQLERYFPSGSPKEGLLINEVVTSNQLSLQDQVYGSPDWIELYNGSDQSIRLSNYYITDNMEAPQKAFQLPDVSLAPGGFYLLYALFWLWGILHHHDNQKAYRNIPLERSAYALEKKTEVKPLRQAFDWLHYLKRRDNAL